MANRDEERQKLRDAGSCPAVPVNIPAPQLPVRPAVPCDPPEEAPAPDRFISPPGIVTPPRPEIVAPTLTIYSDQVTVTCAELENAGPNGAAVTIVEGQFSETFTWLDVADITQAELRFIATLEPVALLNALLLKSVAEGADVFHLSQDKTRAAQDIAREIKSEVNSQARVIGLGLLECAWPNQAQQANCDIGALFTHQQGLTELAVWNPSRIEAGEYDSRESQAIANQIALTAARTALLCAYPNDAVTRTCVDIGFDSVPNDDEDWPLIGRRRTGSVLVPANTFFSANSKADANDIAAAYAESLLSCLFINDATTITCHDIGKTGTEAVIPGDPVNSVAGNPVTVPQGFLFSDISQDAANSQARDIALGLLDCAWVNIEVAAECPARDILDPDDITKTITIFPSTRSPAIRVVVPAGTIRSDVSQADADEQARQIALGQLQCLYCNRIVYPQCVPPSILPRVVSGELKLPLPLTLVDSTWSADATLGVPADTYCDPDPNIAQVLPGIEPPIGVFGPVNVCRYGNDSVSTNCRGETIPSSASSLEGFAAIPPNTFMVTNTEVPAAFHPGDPNRVKLYANEMAVALTQAILSCEACNKGREFTCKKDLGKPNVHPDSFGTDEKPIIVEPNIFCGSSPALVDKMEHDFGLAQLYCFYYSRSVVVKCTDDPTEVTGGDDPLSRALKIGDGTMTPKDGSGPRMPVHPDSTGSETHPIEVEADSFISYDSQEEADARAKKLSVSLLKCFWKNVPVQLLCGAEGDMPWGHENNNGAPVVYGDGDYRGGTVITEPGAPGTAVTLDSDTFESEISPKAATKYAYEIARASLNCCWGNKDTHDECARPLEIGYLQIFSAFATHVSDIDLNSQLSCRDQATANAAARRLLRALLLCSFTNNTVFIVEGGGGGGEGGGTPSPCTPEETRIGPDSLPPDSAHALSGSRAATNNAKSLLLAMQTCISMDGLAGDNGAQTNCDSTCLAIYS